MEIRSHSLFWMGRWCLCPTVKLASKKPKNKNDIKHCWTCQVDSMRSHRFLKTYNGRQVKVFGKETTPKRGHQSNCLCKWWRCWMKYSRFNTKTKAPNVTKWPVLPCSGSPGVVFMSSPKKEAFLPFVSTWDEVLSVGPVAEMCGSLSSSLYLFSATELLCFIRVWLTAHVLTFIRFLRCVQGAAVKTASCRKRTHVSAVIDVVGWHSRKIQHYYHVGEHL